MPSWIAKALQMLLNVGFAYFRLLSHIGIRLFIKPLFLLCFALISGPCGIDTHPHTEAQLLHSQLQRAIGHCPRASKSRMSIGHVSAQMRNVFESVAIRMSFVRPTWYVSVVCVVVDGGRLGWNSA